MKKTGKKESNERDRNPVIIRARAEARAILSDASRPPSFIVRFFYSRGYDAMGYPIGPIEPLDSATATVDGITLVRGENETQQEFIDRIWGAMLPMKPTFAVMWPAESDDTNILLTSRQPLPPAA